MSKCGGFAYSGGLRPWLWDPEVLADSNMKPPPKPTPVQLRRRSLIARDVATAASAVDNLRVCFTKHAGRAASVLVPNAAADLNEAARLLGEALGKLDAARASLAKKDGTAAVQ